MTGGLLVICVCYLITAAGLAGVAMPARILLIVAGLCSAGIATSPEPPSGPTATHLAWAAIGGVTIAVWPAVAGWRLPERPLVLGVWSSTIVTAMFVTLLAWVFLETRGGSDLGLAERLDSGVQSCWPFVVALVLRRSGRDRPEAALPVRPDGARADAEDDDWQSDTAYRC
jgi:peptidoglycan/LPS O-acetylase OafA/YrhL